MAQKNHPDVLAAALAPDVFSADRTPDHVPIFSAPGLGVVFHWWVESNRRWTERNGSKLLCIDHVVLPGGDDPVPVDSDRD